MGGSQRDVYIYCLTNSGLVYEPKCMGGRGGGIAGSQPASTALHVEPKYTLNRVADPNPDQPDSLVFGPPGSGSGSIRQMYGSGSSSGSESSIIRQKY